MSIFTSIPKRRIPRSTFSLRHENKLTGNLGKLIPILNLPVVPGDVVRDNVQLVIKFSPLLAPIMHNVNAFVHFFYVPDRIINEEWEGFIESTFTVGNTPHVGSVPCINSDTLVKAAYFANTGEELTSDLFNSENFSHLISGGLADYLGLPIDTMRTEFSGTGTNLINVTPFLAYQKIYNEFYRDQNLQTDLFPDDGTSLSTLVSNPNLFNNSLTPEPTNSKIQALLTLRNRCWRKDYFTSALPWPQRGADVHLPVGTSAPIVGNGDNRSTDWVLSEYLADGYDSSGNNIVAQTSESGSASGVSGTGYEYLHAYGQENGTKGQFAARMNVKNANAIADSLLADLSNATGLTVNDFRNFVATQQYLEAGARSGGRYSEIIPSFFGAFPGDSRLQRPEYLGGGRIPIMVSQVLQTSESQTTPQGYPTGTAVGTAARECRFRYRVKEHGTIIAILSVMPVPNYQQGIPRQFLKTDPLDYYWPDFAQLGEQPIYNEELYANTSSTKGTFGYTPRYAEYKYHASEIHGDFRDQMAYWHMGRIFSKSPTLSSEFVTVDESKDNLDRVFAVLTDSSGNELPHLWVQMFHDLTASRPMPKYGLPKQIV